MTTTILMYAQILSAVFLIGAVLLQQKGEGLGAGIGGSSMEYSTKRGVEKVVFTATIIFAIIFVGVSIARLML